LVVCGFVGGGITVVVVTEVTVSVSDLALVNMSDVPVTLRTVVPSRAELEAAIESAETAPPPEGGVTGFR
jgi:hypothetical protein